MSEPVYALDASALLALFLGEPGADRVRELIPYSLIGAVNLSEVIAKLKERDVLDEDVDLSLAELNLEIVPFNDDQAVIAGRMRMATRSAGLSFGDRACLTLAKLVGATALTTDRAWEALDIGIAVELAR